MESASAPKRKATGRSSLNTGITGYQEIFTDPSYCGQIVILTNPEIGNYGANESDSESARPYIEGLVVREFSEIASNWRSSEHAADFLAKQRIPIIAEIDTRALVRHLRTEGAMRGVISSLETNADKLTEKARSIPTMAGLDLATSVSTKQRYEWTKGRRSVLSVGDRRTGRRAVAPRRRLRLRHQAPNPCGGCCLAAVA